MDFCHHALANLTFCAEEAEKRIRRSVADSLDLTRSRQLQLSESRGCWQKYPDSDKVDPTPREKLDETKYFGLMQLLVGEHTPDVGPRGDVTARYCEATILSV